MFSRPTKDENARFDRLAIRAKNDPRAREDLVIALTPHLKRMAQQMPNKVKSFVDHDDFLSAAYESVLKDIQKGVKGSKLLPRAYYWMIHERGKSHPIITTKNQWRVNKTRRVLREQTGKDPTADEIYEYMQAHYPPRERASIEVVRAALSAMELPAHLDFNPGEETVGESASIGDGPELALTHIDTYFDEDPPELHDALMRRIDALTPYKRHVLETYVDTGSLELTNEICQTNYKPSDFTHELRKIAEIDESEHCYAWRILEREVVRRVEAQPELLDLLGPRGRLYYESMMAGDSPSVNANKHGVTVACIRSTLERATRKLSKALESV